jgi:ABC-type branched-subunit amino acid transport system substrate-binding protein
MKKFALIVTLVLLAAACGQKPGVHEAFLAQNPAGNPVGPVPTDASGSPLPTTASGSPVPTNSAGSPLPVPSGSSTAPPSDPGGKPTSGDTTGVTDTGITIGIHAPLSGAAPISPESFRAGKDLYWQHGNNGGAVVIHGRKVSVVFQDDHYNPNYAVQVCQKMAEGDHAFLLVGGGGTDQIQACARYAASKGIPYLSAGVTELGLSPNQTPNYFAVSSSYPNQTKALAQYVVNKLDGKNKRIAAVIANTPNFDDARDAFKANMGSYGVDVSVFQPGKDDSGTGQAQNLCNGTTKKFDVVFALMAPSHYLEMAGAAKCQPTFVGVGVSFGLDEVADLGCSSGGTASGQVHVFSPAPSFAQSNDYDPAFRQAGGTDDIMFLLWGISKILAQAFEKTGENLNREAFMYTLQNEFKNVQTGVFPDLSFSPTDHFGADQVYLLKNVCTGNGGHYELEYPERRTSF